MDKQALETKLHFSQPIRQIIMMMLAIGLASIGLFMALNDVIAVVTANLYLNGFIFFVFCVGIISCFVQVFQLIYSVRWIENFARDPGIHHVHHRYLHHWQPAALARVAHANCGIVTRSILDLVATRIEEAREITRYIVNLLIFLGLLGTFLWLATTVPSLVETIRSLAPEDGESGFEVFNRLMNGLKDSYGMGVAFSSSLLGLAGSLLVGLLELFADTGKIGFTVN